MTGIVVQPDPVDRETSRDAGAAIDRIDRSAVAALQQRVIERDPRPTAQRRTQDDGRLAANSRRAAFHDAVLATRRPHQVELDSVLELRGRDGRIVERQPEVHDRQHPRADDPFVRQVGARAGPSQPVRERRIAQVSERCSPIGIQHLDAGERDIDGPEIRDAQLVGKVPFSGDPDWNRSRGNLDVDRLNERCPGLRPACRWGREGHRQSDEHSCVDDGQTPVSCSVSAVRFHQSNRRT